jgi:hypothetical protein
VSEQATPPPPAAAPGAQPYGAAPAPEQKKSGGVIKSIIRYIAILVVVGIGVFVYKQVTGAPETAAVGDCMVGQSADALKTTDCNGGEAEWKVVGKLDDQPENVTTEQACAAFPTTEVSFWEGDKGGKGYVLCLEPIKK